MTRSAPYRTPGCPHSLVGRVGAPSCRSARMLAVTDDERPAKPDQDELPGDKALYWRPLRKWERTGAMVAGSVIGGLGFLAMFFSGNQAGPAVALLIGGV